MHLIVCSPVGRDSLDRQLGALPGLTVTWAATAERRR
jgi:hypothetical protein